jgi:hypothetical protein
LPDSLAVVNQSPHCWLTDHAALARLWGARLWRARLLEARLARPGGGVLTAQADRRRLFPATVRRRGSLVTGTAM